jgi:preprotein translocase subunit SecB
MNYKIVARYIKNLNFEIPNPKTFFLLEKNISNYKINIDIKSHQFKDKIIDVQTTLSLSSENEDSEKIYTKIVYSTIIEIDGEIRSLFVLLFEKSGFKKINIEEKIDFKKLYLKKFTQ